MRETRIIVLFALFLLGFQSCYKEEVVYNSEANSNLELPTIFRINGKDCCYDYTESSLRFPIEDELINDFSPFIEFQEYSTVYFEGRLLQNNSINSLGKIEINKEYKLRVETLNKTQQLALTFTSLPIVQIITPNTILDEPKTIARITVNYVGMNESSDSYYVGIEHRGGRSQLYDKKSFGFSLKGSVTLDDNISNSFFGMNSNNDWILDAMWIDCGRLRNKTSFELWKKFDEEKNDGISSKFVELYINNEHQGLYCFNENINSEFFSLTNEDAVLYKAISWENGATGFGVYESNPPLNYFWSGWEQKYPDPKIEINWKPLSELRRLAVNESDDVFRSQITSFIDIDNFIDYYILLNIVSASDNTGKNTFLVKANSQDKFHILPWDIDGSWGLSWDGSHDGYTSILSNNLFDRLIETNPDDFVNKLKFRWSSLRAGVLSNIELKKLFADNFNLINNSDIIEIENKKWESNIDMDEEEEYLMNWLENRTDFLDNYFNDL